ncbi:hypothetical protein ABI_24810 [Asticcacaulis biprosthecium C19]|uniref:Uncharacterized protein n=1 Tax=Asticcacaulis biprosthecium C19 TaxID=715226 RepID=F4QP10_9CAUL|nr:hypothetical protein ABI_24810 [Asticcacaulis biprosthecium C19]
MSIFSPSDFARSNAGVANVPVATAKAPEPKCRRVMELNITVLLLLLWEVFMG